MTGRVPLLAILLGVFGLVPFLACGLMALSPDPVQSARMELALLAYGAVILSFLGGVHWGFALLTPASTPARFERLRLVLGVLPALAGWIAVLLPRILAPWSGLLLLIAAFIATAVVEQQAERHGLMPRGYIWLRWALTIAVSAILITVFTLRLLGQSLNY